LQRFGNGLVKIGCCARNWGDGNAGLEGHGEVGTTTRSGLEIVGFFQIFWVEAEGGDEICAKHHVALSCQRCPWLAKRQRCNLRSIITGTRLEKTILPS
jgi:hypothetical protein